MATVKVLILMLATKLLAPGLWGKKDEKHEVVEKLADWLILRGFAQRAEEQQTLELLDPPPPAAAPPTEDPLPEEGGDKPRPDGADDPPEDDPPAETSSLSWDEIKEKAKSLEIPISGGKDAILAAIAEREGGDKPRPNETE
jgi:hypothetical protein